MVNKLPRFAIAGVAVLVFSNFVVPHVAVGDPVGYGFSWHVYASDSISETGSEVSVFDSSSISYFATVSQTNGGIASASIGIFYGNGNIDLHGIGAATSPAGVGETNGAFTIYYHDTLNILGSGQQTFRYTLTLRGSSRTYGMPPDDDVTSANGILGLFLNSSYHGVIGQLPVENPECRNDTAPDGNPCGGRGEIPLSVVTAPDGGTYTSELQLMGGTSIELGLFLSGSAFTYNYFAKSQNISAVIDAGDGGFLTLTPVTDGAGFTTASGLTYSADPGAAIGVPEPTTLALLSVALLGTLYARRRVSLIG